MVQLGPARVLSATTLHAPSPVTLKTTFRQRLDEERQKALAGGGEKRVKKQVRCSPLSHRWRPTVRLKGWWLVSLRCIRQHDKGKLTARERVELLLDEGSFSEYDQLKTHRCKVRRPPPPLLVGATLACPLGPTLLSCSAQDLMGPHGPQRCFLASPYHPCPVPGLRHGQRGLPGGWRHHGQGHHQRPARLHLQPGQHPGKPPRLVLSKSRTHTFLTVRDALVPSSRKNTFSDRPWVPAVGAFAPHLKVHTREFTGWIIPLRTVCTAPHLPVCLAAGLHGVRG
jgi:hypothetical protein